MAASTRYRPEYAAQARKLAPLCASEAELGEYFGVVERTVQRWKQQHPDFAEALETIAGPTEFNPEYVSQARKLTLLGATDEEVADFFGVRVRTVYRWKQQQPEFAAALAQGKAKADAQVATKLYHRALGYSHKAVKIVADANSGKQLVVEYIERYPPDTLACIYWLKNRRPDIWRDRHNVDVTSNGQTMASLAAEAYTASPPRPVEPPQEQPSVSVH